MKKIVLGGIATGAMWLLMAATALAQDGSDLGPPGGEGVGGVGGSVGSGGGTAFTGGEIAGLIIAALVLVAVGTTLVLVARRRTAASGSGA